MKNNLLMIMLLFVMSAVAVSCVKNSGPAAPEATATPQNTMTSTFTATVSPTSTITMTPTSTSTPVVVIFSADKDAGGMEIDPTGNYGSCVNLTIGGINGDLRYGYFHFDTSSIPAGATVLAAEFYFTYYSWNSNNGGMILRALPVDFVEGVDCGTTATTTESCWNSPGTGTWPIGYAGGNNIAIIGPPGGIVYERNVTMTATDLAPLQQWVNDNGTNKGIVMLGMGSSISEYIIIYNREESAGAKAAKLKITYRY